MSSVIERLGESQSVQTWHAADRSIGRILLDAGKLKAGDAERALRLAKEKSIRFGEACLQLKLVTQADIDSALSRQFDYPYLHPGEANLSDELVAAYHPFITQVEELRALRTQLLLRWFSADRRVLAIASPARGDGRTYLAANLAIVFSQLGEKTLLIDADMRNPRQHKLFKLSNQYGLSALLTGRVDTSAIERVGHFANLSVLPAGATPPNPLELVSRPEFKELLAHEATSFDVVLIDTPAAEYSSDAQAIAARAGGALILARQNRSRLDAVGRLTAEIQGTKAAIVGCVINHV
ncbi:MAG: chain length determinant protein tyrosine kinase EpsG [Burkholderiales bacterium]|nr:chain length determinant protein tyrosine kinase EpsG [Burkholderiales bacterium]